LINFTLRRKARKDRTLISGNLLRIRAPSVLKIFMLEHKIQSADLLENLTKPEVIDSFIERLEYSQ
jgi:hypothetical protein